MLSGLSGAEGSKQGPGFHAGLTLSSARVSTSSLLGPSPSGHLELLFKKYSDYFSGPGKVPGGRPHILKGTQTCTTSKAWSRCSGLVQKSAGRQAPRSSALPLPGPGAVLQAAAGVPDPLTPQSCAPLGGSRCPGAVERVKEPAPGSVQEGPGQGLGPRLPSCPALPEPRALDLDPDPDPSFRLKAPPIPVWSGGEGSHERGPPRITSSPGPHWSGARFGGRGLAVRARRALALGLRDGLPGSRLSPGINFLLRKRGEFLLSSPLPAS